jgi:probable HAF family extracellular repeat protein
MSYTDTVPNPTTGLPTVHPFLWKNGRMQDLGSLGGTLASPGSFSEGPWGPTLNESGQAVGNSWLPGDRIWHAFLWENGRMTDLGTLGGRYSEPRSINGQGLIVGRADYSTGSPYHHAVLWRDGVIHDLGVVAPCLNSTAVAVNGHGDIVGGLGACNGNPNDIYYYGAFIRRNGSPMVDLDSLVDPPSDLHLNNALDINDQGEIAANAYTADGEYRGVVLIPITD